MALIFKYKGDVGNKFELITDGLPGFNSFHIEEVRGVNADEIALGVNVNATESTRLQIKNIALNGGFQLEEFDDSLSLGVLLDPPRITALSPEKLQKDVAVAGNIVLTFSENIAKAVSTGPTIKLINLDTNLIVETFEFDSALAVVATNQLTINPTSNLSASTNYALLIDKAYITNVEATEYHGGIYSQDFYTFATA